MPDAQIKLDVKLGTPRCVFFFDEFGVVRKDGYVFLHLGFKGGGYDGAGIIIAIGDDIVTNNKDSFLKYLNDIGLPETSLDGKYRAREAREIVFADIWGVARHGNSAEMLFHCFSWKVVVDKSRVQEGKTAKSKEPKETAVYDAYCVAIVRSGLEVHRNLISTIYAPESEE